MFWFSSPVVHGAVAILTRMAVACAGLLLAGCAPAATSDARAVADRFVAGSGQCALLSPGALEKLADQDPRPCQEALGSLGIPHQPVSDVQVWGDEAQARTGADVLFLHEFPDGWRVTGAGCRPRGEDQPYQCAVDGT